jgi:hypothetical protein
MVLILLYILILSDEHPNLLFKTFTLYLLGPGFESQHHSDGFFSDAYHSFPQTMQAYAKKINKYYGRFFSLRSFPTHY